MIYLWLTNNQLINPTNFQCYKSLQNPQIYNLKFEMSEYIDQTITRIGSSVKGIIIVKNSTGEPVRTTFELNKKESDEYAKYIFLLTKKARSMVRDLDPMSDISFLRIKTKNQEIMVTPDQQYTLIAIQVPKLKNQKKQDQN